MTSKKTTPLSQKISRDTFFKTRPDFPRVFEAFIKDLSLNPYQPRKTFNPETIQELAESIKQRGLLQPIVVQKNPEGNGYIIAAGERRFRAYQLLGEESIPAILATGHPDELALIENIQREDLHPIDEALALQGLIERYGYTQEELAGVVGKSRVSVTELLSLTHLVPEVQEECRTSDISKSALVEIARVEDPAAQSKLLAQAKAGRLTVATAREAKPARKKVEASPKAQTEVKASQRHDKLQTEPGEIQTPVKQQTQRIEALELELDKARREAEKAMAQASQLEEELTRVQKALEIERESRASADQAAEALKKEIVTLTERAAQAEELHAQIETLQAQLASIGRPTSLPKEKKPGGRKAGSKRGTPVKKAGKKSAGRSARGRS
jgi:ParB family chromosome partitioning protein